VVLLSLAGIAMAIGQAFFAAVILSNALAHTAQSIVPAIAGFAGMAIGRAGLAVFLESASFKLGADARRSLRDDAMARLLAGGGAILRRHHSAELATAVIDQVEALEGFFARWVPATLLAVAGPLLVVVALAFSDWRAALLVTATGLLVPLGMAAAGIGAAVASRRQFQAMTRLQARFLDRVRGIATIVLYGRAEDEALRLGDAASELRVRTMRVLRVAFLSSAFLDCAAAAALVLLALRYGAALLAGRLAHPEIALFSLLLVPEFFAPLRSYAAAYQDQFQARAAAETMAHLPAMPDTVPIQDVRTVAARGVSVSFENVGLTWDPARGPALDGLSFRVPAGETLVVAGPSGAGKSSIFEILLGFVRPDSGRVVLNGADIVTIVPQSLARMTAWIGQRPLLFAGSLRENIRFARPEASDAEIEEAARLARVSGFAAELPAGLDTLVGESGYGLSGGQAQRVAVARAFLKNAPVLLLDEPTAHLDPATEAEVLESLRRLAVGRTVILASHSAAAHGFQGRRIDIRAGRLVDLSAGARGAA
jgi:ATP-binding cassette subfamily C protein CydD